MKVDYRTGKITEIDLPSKEPRPHAIDTDTKRNLKWFDEFDADKLVRYESQVKSFVEFPLPSTDTGVFRPVMDPTYSSRFSWNTYSSIGYFEAMD